MLTHALYHDTKADIDALRSELLYISGWSDAHHISRRHDYVIIHEDGRSGHYFEL